MSAGSNRPEVKWGWLAAIGVSLAVTVLGQLVVALVVAALGWDLDNLSLSQTYTLGTLSLIFPVLGLWWYLSRRQASPADIGLGSRPKRFLKPLLKNFGLYILYTMLAVFVVTTIAPSIDLDQAQNLGLGDQPSTWLEYTSLFLLLAVFTPLSEEIIFRGFMLRGMAGRFGWTAAAVFTSLMFGVAHGQINVAIDTAIMGWFSAQLVITTDSLWPSIALHSLKNTIAFALVFLGPLLS